MLKCISVAKSLQSNLRMTFKQKSRFGFLKDRHLGQRVVIVANGPSLNVMNLSFLKQEIVIGLNKIFLGFKKFNFYPRYYVAVNEKLIRQSANEIKKLTSVKFLSNRCPDLFEEDSLTYIINTMQPPASFCHDIALGVREGGTVTYVALQIAFYLGFQEVIIIGMDHKYSYSGEANQTSILKGPDPNHFSKEYFGFGQRWDNPDLPKSERFYKLARFEYERAGRQILDATVEGACNIFEKVNYTEHFHFLVVCLVFAVTSQYLLMALGA